MCNPSGVRFVTSITPLPLTTLNSQFTMAIISVFNFTTLNGFYKGPNQDISWHKHGVEEEQFSAEGAKAQTILLFGRTTYKMMASFWPTPQAMKLYPETAEGMNASEKIVFSNRLKTVDWENTTIMNGDIIRKMKNLKKKSKKDFTILGSGSIISQFADAGLIDVYQIMIDPVAIGKGTPMFKGIEKELNLKLTDTRMFKETGIVMLTYEKG